MTTTPTRRVFVDTQGWAEMYHDSALHHAQADAFLAQSLANNWQLITSNLILSELVPLLNRARPFRLPQSQPLSIISRIRALPNLIIEHVDPTIDALAWDLLYANSQPPGRMWTLRASC